MVSPILAIIALVKISIAQKRIAEHEKRLNILSKTLAQQIPNRAPEKTVPAPPLPAPETEPQPATQVSLPVAPPQPRPQPVPSSQPKQLPKKPKRQWEEALGGKVAGLVGVMILVAGIAFLVGSRGITWPAPLFKIMTGLACGGILLAAGHAAHRTADGKFVLLARLMTGGGGGLFYFCIFAAYSFYQLCGPVVTALGLTVSAALLLGLSLFYNSQTVATLGILGAFITPLLTGGDVDRGIFPLAYIALINLPVMLLGIKKNWQVLYNSASVFTVFYFFFWMISFSAGRWLIPLSAIAIYFAEFMTLSLLILNKQKRGESSGINLARIIASTLFLFISVYSIFYSAHIEDWLGTAFAVISGIFAVLASLSWKQLPKLKDETLCFILCGLTAGALFIFEAVPGTWRGLLWCSQALAIVWFFRKATPSKIIVTSILLTLLGSISLTGHVLSDTAAAPVWFNLETMLLLSGTFIVTITCWMIRTNPPTMANPKGSHLLQFTAFGLFLPAACIDIFKLDSADTLPWLAATAAFAASTWFIHKRQRLFIKETLHFFLSALICLTVLLHMLLSGLWISLAWGLLGIGSALFALRMHSKAIQNAAIFIGLAALLQATAQPITTGANWILINPHTLCGLFTAFAIGAQAKLYERIPQGGATHFRVRVLWIACIAAVLFISARNLFTALPYDSPMPWLLTSAIALLIGNIVTWMLGKDSALRNTGLLIIAIIPLKILFLDVLFVWRCGTPPELLSIPLWAQLAMLAEIIWLGGRIKPNSATLRGYFALAPLLAGIAVISLAIGESEPTWSRALVSLWWGLSGLTLTIYGFARRSRLHRRFALLLFAAAVIKVLLIDCSVFELGPRVMILIGSGLLLLILSFIYQKVSAKIL